LFQYTRNLPIAYIKNTHTWGLPRNLQVRLRAHIAPLRVSIAGYGQLLCGDLIDMDVPDFSRGKN
jgi:hypothetical protein